MAEGGHDKPAHLDSVEDSGLQELESELEAIQEKIRIARKKQDREQPLRRQIEAAKKELAAITGVEKAHLSCGMKVAFTAVVSPPQLENLSADKTIVYDEIITNFGDAYDCITGIFTAPVKGIYIFEVALMTDPGKDQYLQLVKDGEHVIAIYGCAKGAKHIVSSSRTATTELSKGCKAWIRTAANPNHGSGFVHGNSYSSFSGWLYANLE